MIQDDAEEYDDTGGDDDDYEGVSAVRGARRVPALTCFSSGAPAC